MNILKINLNIFLGGIFIDSLTIVDTRDAKILNIILCSLFIDRLTIVYTIV